jgi:hypothetical protein
MANPIWDRAGVQNKNRGAPQNPTALEVHPIWSCCSDFLFIIFYYVFAIDGKKIIFADMCFSDLNPPFIGDFPSSLPPKPPFLADFLIRILHS